MKSISEEIIEVDGKEYTLFLNRKGVVAWEKDTAEVQSRLQELENKYSNFEEKIVSEKKKANDDNPFEGLDDVDGMEEDARLMHETFDSLYRIMLYTHHPMNRDKASEWYNKACEEYGEQQMMALGSQMISDMNVDTNQQELKKLKALRPTKE